MKQPVKKLSADEIQKSFPISDRLSDWFFRVRENSAGCCLAEGTDLWGRQVSHQGTDLDEVLRRCVEDALVIKEKSKSA